MELFIQEQIRLDYPDLYVIYNDRSLIGSELDIYIPSIRLAIELNGIVHYEPIYGPDKFERIKDNDKQKLIRCYEIGVELAVIDTSSINKTTRVSSLPFYNIVKGLIDNGLKRK